MRAHLLHRDLFPAWLAPLTLVGLLASCGGAEKAPPADDTAAPAAGGAPATPAPTDTQSASPAQPPADTAAPGGAAPPPPAPDTQTPKKAAGAAGGGGGGKAAQIALGDSIFHGKVGGGTCYACHGQDGKGSAVGPNLTDSEWLNSDGSLEGLVKTIKSGVPTPKKAPAPMPPMGGATLTDEQVQAVAAYEYSLSHGR
jgi:mono/diheme cytochrome c family protein